jgi:hypothetical protein
LALGAGTDAATVMVDAFDQGSHEAHYVNRGGPPGVLSTYVGPGPASGGRALYAFNNHYYSTSLVEVDADAGVAHIVGGSNAANRALEWGTSIGGLDTGFAGLNLNLSRGVAFEIVFVSLAANMSPSILLRTHAGEANEKTFTCTTNLVASAQPFTVTMPFAEFTSGGRPATADDLADLDGVRFWSYSGVEAYMDEFRVTTLGDGVLVILR